MQKHKTQQFAKFFIKETKSKQTDCTDKNSEINELKISLLSN